LRVPVLTRDRHRTADELAVVGVVRPLAAIPEELWHWAPKGQRVIAEMIVELDQARKSVAPVSTGATFSKPAGAAMAQS
jgi:hypothetical protein